LINWRAFSENPAALDLLENSEVNWHSISSSPDIFDYDYESMHYSRIELFEELLAVIFHPENITRFKDRI